MLHRQVWQGFKRDLTGIKIPYWYKIPQLALQIPEGSLKGFQGTLPYGIFTGGDISRLNFTSWRASHEFGDTTTGVRISSAGHVLRDSSRITPVTLASPAYFPAYAYVSLCVRVLRRRIFFVRVSVLCAVSLPCHCTCTVRALCPTPVPRYSPALPPPRKCFLVEVGRLDGVN
jgi:hypothetical protein